MWILQIGIAITHKEREPCHNSTHFIDSDTLFIPSILIIETKQGVITIMTIARQTIFLFNLLAIALVLTACGGGGGSGTAPIVSSKAESSLSNSVASSIEGSASSASSAGSSSSADKIPEAFSFVPATNAALGAATISSSIILSGFDVTVPISIINGEYSINGGAFTSAAGSISPMQTLVVKVIASNANSSVVDATLTVGGVSATYSVTTLADAIPNAFTFTSKIDAALGSINTSDTVTIEGVEVAAPIVITGGEYSINGGAFTSTAGSVANGQTIRVKAVAPAGNGLTHSAIVNIGGVSGTYAITTVFDKTAPVAEFKFPTPYTMSEAMSVKVRGVATDENIITNVKVVVNGTKEITAIPKVEGDFSSWTAEVPLTKNSENEIKVVATDDQGNSISIDAANKVVIRQRVDYSDVFPDTGSPIASTSGLMLDKSKNRLFYASYEDQYKLFEIDIATGAGRAFADFEEQNLRAFGNGVIDSNSQYVYFPLIGGQGIIKLNTNDAADFSVHRNSEYGTTSRIAIFNYQDDIPKLISLRSDSNSHGGVVVTRLDNWNVSVLSDALLGIPNTEVPFEDANSFVFDQKNQRYLVAGTYVDALLAVDVNSGVRSVFSSELVGTGDPYAEGNDGLIAEVALDEPRNRAIVLEIFSGNIFAVDLDTAERSVISQMTLLHPTSQQWPFSEKNYLGAQIDTENELLYTVHHRVQALMVVDLQTGQQLILSKAENLAQ
jgi:hypothetical protein